MQILSSEGLILPNIISHFTLQTYIETAYSLQTMQTELFKIYNDACILSLYTNTLQNRIFNNINPNQFSFQYSRNPKFTNIKRNQRHLASGKIIHTMHCFKSYRTSNSTGQQKPMMCSFRKMNQYKPRSPSKVKMKKSKRSNQPQNYKSIY